MWKDPEVNFYKKYVNYMKLLNIYLNHFPKHEKFGICTSFRQDSYKLFDLITEAEKRYFKKSTLTEMDILVEKLRMKNMLCYELGYYKFKDGKKLESKVNDMKRYENISKCIDEIGRIVGGWIRKVKKENNWK